MFIQKSMIHINKQIVQYKTENSYHVQAVFSYTMINWYSHCKKNHEPWCNKTCWKKALPLKDLMIHVHLFKKLAIYLQNFTVVPVDSQEMGWMNRNYSSIIMYNIHMDTIYNTHVHTCICTVNMQNCNTSIHWNQIPDLYENITEWSQQQQFFTMRSAWTCNKKKNMIWQTGMHILFADMYHGCIHVHRYPWLFSNRNDNNSTIKTWIWQGILNSVYYTVHIQLFLKLHLVLHSVSKLNM